MYENIENNKFLSPLAYLLILVSKGLILVDLCLMEGQILIFFHLYMHRSYLVRGRPQLENTHI